MANNLYAKLQFTSVAYNAGVGYNACTLALKLLIPHC